MHEHHGANRSAVIMYIQVDNWFGNCRWKDVTELTQIQSIRLQKIKSDFMLYFQFKKHALRPFGVSWLTAHSFPFMFT